LRPKPRSGGGVLREGQLAPSPPDRGLGEALLSSPAMEFPDGEYILDQLRA